MDPLAINVQATSNGTSPEGFPTNGDKCNRVSAMVCPSANPVTCTLTQFCTLMCTILCHHGLEE